MRHTLPRAYNRRHQVRNRRFSSSAPPLGTSRSFFSEKKQRTKRTTSDGQINNEGAEAIKGACNQAVTKHFAQSQGQKSNNFARSFVQLWMRRSPAARHTKEDRLWRNIVNKRGTLFQDNSRSHHGAQLDDDNIQVRSSHRNRCGRIKGRQRGKTFYLLLTTGLRPTCSPQTHIYTNAISETTTQKIQGTARRANR